MLDERMIIAGSGGQGVLFLGKLLCGMMMEEGKHVTYVPSYGAEVRGGTCNCHVRLSDVAIYSPLVERATCLVLLNGPSYERFRTHRSADALLLVNSSAVVVNEEDAGFAVEVNATEIADDLGDVRVANMALLGALNARREFVADDTLKRGVQETLAGKGAKVVELNLEALERGAAAVR